MSPQALALLMASFQYAVCVQCGDAFGAELLLAELRARASRLIAVGC